MPFGVSRPSARDFEGRVGGERLDPPGQGRRVRALLRRSREEPVPLDDRKRQLAHLGVGVDQQSLQVLEGVGPAPEARLASRQRQALPAQGGRVVGQGREQERRRGCAPTRAPAGC